VATGGYVKTWQATFYMSIVTVLTIGFGDHAPKSWWGRVVGCLWMMYGVARTANFVATISEWFFSQTEHAEFRKAITEAVDRFDEIDKDGDRKLNRAEFLNFMLVQHNLVPQDVIDHLNGMFDEMQNLHNGTEAVARDDLLQCLKVTTSTSPAGATPSGPAALAASKAAASRSDRRSSSDSQPAMGL